MVVFVDLESSDDEPSINLRAKLGISPREGLAIQARSSVNNESAERAGKEQSHTFAAILTCYPAALSLSSHLDLNDLYSLSLTCRSLHTSLTQYASQLTANSLRCSLDPTGTARASSCEDTNTNRIATGISTSHGSLGLRGITAPWTTKWKPCARDLVAPCRRCGIVICRNCSAKAPSDRYLTERYRRLCQTCLEAPLEEHLQPLRHVDEIAGGDTPPSSGSSSARSVPSSSETISETDPMAGHLENAPNEHEAFTCPAFIRKPCDCASNGVHLCRDCGHNLRSNDTTYRRVWTWRSRYSTHMGGGIGTGLGMGNQGQKCGRGEHCLDSSAESVAWVEIDCSEGTATGSSFEQDVLIGARSATPTIDHSTPSPMGNRPGYYSQEVEGIGGVVKKKVKKRVKVGAAVYEWDDERKSGNYLEHESSGKERSWCGWCGRVCLRRADSQAQAQSIR